MTSTPAAPEPAPQPDQRQRDGGRGMRRSATHRWVRENWYRDIWLIVITLCWIGTTVVAVTEPGRRFDAIQRSRYEVQRDACLAQNKRNTKAKQVARELKVSYPVVVKIIDELAPYEKDCDAVARGRVEVPRR